MAGEEMMSHQEEVIKKDAAEGNDPDSKPLSETGYLINPDGSISKPKEEWDKE